ncbi:hypothetical protein BAY1663_02728 [Pseudomonas sp. BAY1663]|uniref:hypothetical protein n=1 Tax=Pseudomonas sp. BAY1663 TaxID=1439940 RepID=UPI00042E00BC|nr:hypothetical protein [Pseudomonas sp. BAY1663]EXF44836.1 hypothetical protein BAY1663_02728 [Pseudomonas sp. BAY1663]
MSEEWKDYLKEMLFDRDPANVDVQAANIFKRRFIPKKLYKYRTITKYALDNLVNNTLHLTTASRFNDPYDSALTVDPFRSKTGRDMIDGAIASAELGRLMTCFVSVLPTILTREMADSERSYRHH